MAKITCAKKRRWNGRGFDAPEPPIILRNPHDGFLLPFIICHSAGELINWRTREKKALKRYKKTGSPFPFPQEFYSKELLECNMRTL